MFSTNKPTLLFLVIVFVIALTFDSILIPVSADNFKRINRKRGGCTGTFSGDGTYYEIGLGACGVTNTDSQLVAAMPWEMFDSYTPNGNPNKNPNCFKNATVHYTNDAGVTKSVVVQFMDRCAGCKYGDIDLSPAAFQCLAPLSLGRIHVTYTMN